MGIDNEAVAGALRLHNISSSENKLARAMKFCLRNLSKTRMIGNIRLSRAEFLNYNKGVSGYSFGRDSCRRKIDSITQLSEIIPEEYHHAYNSRLRKKRRIYVGKKYPLTIRWAQQGHPPNTYGQVDFQFRVVDD